MKRNNGITLIALVVTIIVLIILAGVSVNLVLGQNGIITKAKEAKKNHEREAVKEKVSLMMGECATEREENGKSLKNYLEDQEKLGKIESIGESEDNEEGTQTIVIDGYGVVIDEETLEILEIEKVGPKPKISNIKITYIDTTDGVEKEATEKSVIEGTPLKITFDVSFEEGTLVRVNKGTLENGKVEYTTDGAETKVIFIVIGKIGEEEYQRSKKIKLEEFYKQAIIADAVKVGDFVNYSAGNWTQEDINMLNGLYEGVGQPAVHGNFGGFAIGQSKDSTANLSSPSETNVFNSGWRVNYINEDGSVQIIHAGTPFLFLFGRGSNLINGYINILKDNQYWKMFEDSTTNAIDTNYAIEGSARSVVLGDISWIGVNSNLRSIGIRYYYHYAITSNYVAAYLSGITSTGEEEGAIAWGGCGLRPSVALKSTVKVKSKPGQTTHDTPETAWILSLEE